MRGELEIIVVAVLCLSLFVVGITIINARPPEPTVAEADLDISVWIYIGMSVENVCRLWGEPYSQVISDEKPQVTYFWFDPLRYVTFSTDTEVWRVVDYMGYYERGGP